MPFRKMLSTWDIAKFRFSRFLTGSPGSDNKIFLGYITIVLMTYTTMYNYN